MLHPIRPLRARWLLFCSLLGTMHLAGTAAEPVRYANSTTFADSVVTFNEVMYQPAGDDPALEWIELHNQHIVLEDLSNWTIEGGIDFRFPPDTTLPPNGYLVVAADPAAFKARTGVTALGPFTGRLDNAGDRLVLRNHNHRLMDELEYRDSVPWPATPDGSGASLAKRVADSPSSPPENWRGSTQVDGTPGADNFPTANQTPATTFDVFVTNRTEGRWWIPRPADSEIQWQQAAFDDSAWLKGTNGFGFASGNGAGVPKADRYYRLEGNSDDASGNGVHGSTPGGGEFIPNASPVSGSSTALHFDGIDDRVEVPDPGAHAAYSLSLWVRFDEVRPGSLVVLTDNFGPNVSWSHQLRVNGAGVFEHYNYDGEWNVVSGVTQIQPGVWYHVAATAESNGSARLYVNGVEEGTPENVHTLWAGGQRWLFGTDSSGFPNYLHGSLDEVAIWERVLTSAEVGGLAAGSVPGSPGSLAGNFLTDLGPSMKQVNASAWLRHTFAAPSATGYDQLTLRVRYDDGFVAWLNGVEVARRNAGSTAWNSTANTARPDADSLVLETIDLSAHAGLLRPSGNVLAVQALNASAGDPDILFSSELSGRRRNIIPDAVPPVVFSEVTSADRAGFWCEIVNIGTTGQALNGLRIRSSAGGEYLFAATVIDAGARLTLGTNQLGFTVQPDDRLFLVGGGGFQVLDAVRLTDEPQARRAERAGDTFLRPSNPTPGAANTFKLHDEIVINEILYHAPATEAGESEEQWVELLNRSNQSIDLEGWRLRGDIEFKFPPSTPLGPGEYLVVARHAAELQLVHPDVRILGDWKGSLGGRIGHLILEDAETNPAFEVRYFDDAPWPARADGGGGSLELRNPALDPSVPEAWAASDESSRSAWKAYTYRAKAIAPVKAPDQSGFHELRMGLLADGEVLVDDVSVIEDPDGTHRQLIQNGAFNDASAWRFLGNHSHSAIAEDPDVPGNKVLRLVATDARGYMHNQLETTFKFNKLVVPVVAGRTYEVAFRAKWIGGSRLLNTEFYYNKVIKTVRLDIPLLHGTPGRRNSTYMENPGPTFSGLQHFPLVPKAGEAVTVSVRPTDPDGIATLQLFTSVNGAAWQSRPMTESADGSYSATVPAQTLNAVVQFYVEGRDTLGAVSTIPAGGTNSRALYRVDARTAKAPRKAFRFILTLADGRLMDSVTNMMSDDRVGATVVWNEREVFYDCGVHLHGSMFTRNGLDTVPYNLKFPADHKFRGVHRTVQVNRGTIEEIIAKHAQVQTGIPGMYEDIVELFSHRTANAGAARLSLAHYNDIYLGSQFENGTDGMLFNMEGIRVLSTTHNGSPEGIKLAWPTVGWIGDYDIMNLGDDPEQYRWSTTLRNNRAKGDYSRYVAMAKAFSLSGAALEQAVPAVMDVDQWMRYYALLTLFEIGDTYTLGNPHNIGFYARPTDGRVIALPYDWDFFFANGDTSALWGNQNLVKIITRPVYTRLLYGNLLDMIDGVFTTNYLSKYITSFGQAAGQSYSQYLPRIRARANYVRGRLPAKVPFEVTSNAGADFAVTTPTTVIEGRGWVDVADIRVPGQPGAQFTWLDGSRWRAEVVLPDSTNRLQFQAFNRRGDKVGEDSVTVVTTGAEDSQRRFLRISEIHYHPADATAVEFNAGFKDADDFEFVEVANYGPAAVSLDGVRFTLGVQFDFTSSTITNLPAGARAVVVRNPAAFIARYGTSIPVAGAYSDGLANGGERLQLVDRHGLVIHDVTYDDQPPWPVDADGDGNSLELIAADGAIGSAEGWRLGLGGGTPGSGGTPPEAVVVSRVLHLDGKVHVRFIARAGFAYRLQGRAEAGGGAWEDLQSVPPGPIDHEEDLVDSPGAATRFYRLASP